MRIPAIAGGVALILAFGLVVLALRLDIDPIACRETDPITATFEPSIRGQLIDPVACAQAEEAIDRRHALLLGAAVAAVVGVASLIGGAALARKRQRDLPPPIDRGFPSA